MTTQYRRSPLPSEAATQASMPQGKISREGLPSSRPAAGLPPDADPTPETTPTLTLTDPDPDADYDYVHYIIIGSPDGVADAINRLHVGHRIERHRWTPFIPVREEGLHITPAEGQVLSYLIRQRPKG